MELKVYSFVRTTYYMIVACMFYFYLAGLKVDSVVCLLILEGVAFTGWVTSRIRTTARMWVVNRK